VSTKPIFDLPEPLYIILEGFRTFTTRMRSLSGRGALIVFEGCDRAGKTTQVQNIVKFLNEEAGKLDSAKMMRFPDRSTQIGTTIDKYLKGTSDLDDHVIHLLFSANRWEKVGELRAALEAGTHVVVDRYAFSGVAFSAAKPGLGLDWCKGPDRGLPQPDLVCFLDVSAQEAMKRGGFGEERYERAEFQARVRKNYDQLMDPHYWRVVDTDGKTQDAVYQEIRDLVKNTIDSRQKDGELKPLWQSKA